MQDTRRFKETVIIILLTIQVVQKDFFDPAESGINHHQKARQGDAHEFMRFMYRIEIIDALTHSEACAKPIVHLFESRLGGTYR